MDIPILFEDGEALVINKPAGLPLDRPRAGGPALDDYLPKLRLGFAREPQAVHRLDRDTSGCLLLARNPKALKRFSAAFEARLVEKRYLGIVATDVAGEQGTIDLPLAKISSALEGWRMVVAQKGQHRDAKSAVTHWEVLERRNGLTLVAFHPETGRTHQIRVHSLHGLGAALLGDQVYGEGDAADGASRTMLHAADLVVGRGVVDEGGKPPIIAHAPLPPDFRALGFVDPQETVVAGTGEGPQAEGPEVAREQADERG